MNCTYDALGVIIEGRKEVEVYGNLDTAKNCIYDNRYIYSVSKEIFCQQVVTLWVHSRLIIDKCEALSDPEVIF